MSLTEVLADITGDGLDIGSGRGGRSIVDDLVTGEESESVGVLGEFLDGRKDILQIDGVVRGLGVGPVERVLGSVDIEDEVDASISQRLHTLIVALGVVDGVDTDGVHAQLLELGDIALASGRLRDGVLQLGGATGLVVDTTDVEAVVTLEESVSFDGDRGDTVTGLDLLGQGHDGRGAHGDGGRHRSNSSLHDDGCRDRRSKMESGRLRKERQTSRQESYEVVVII